jgi:CubicO group peptidase (beta-lactamase class C family)
LKAATALLRAWIAVPAWLCAAPAIATADDGAWIETQRLQWQVPGLAVAIVERGRPPQIVAAGLCNLEKSRPCAARSQFAIGSNTKLLTGLLAAVLAEQGMLQLDTPLAEAWPGLALGDARGAALTLRDLLSQRSGLGSVDWPYLWDPALDRDDYLARLRHVPAVAAPRERWHYANANYVLAGAWIERATGHDWRALLRHHLLRPLRMRDAGFGRPDDGTRGYTGADEATIPAVAWTAEALAPAGSLLLSARDWAQLLAAIVDPAHANGRVLSPQAVATALAPQIGLDDDPRFVDGPGGYALGLFTARYGGDEVRYHIGRTVGFTSAVLLLPQRGLAIAVTANVDNTDLPPALAFALADRRRGRSGDQTLRRWHALRSADAPPGAGEAPAAPALRPGRYTHPAWGSFVIAGDDRGGLRIRMAQLDAPLRPTAAGDFVFEPARNWPPLRLRPLAHGDSFSLDDASPAAGMRFVRASAADD